MLLNAFINRLDTYEQRLKKSMQNVGYEVSKSVFNGLKAHSPVDSGEYKSRWQMLRLNTGRDSIFSMSFVNRTPYAFWMEYGGERRGNPWRFPNKQNPGPVSKSGKLKAVGHRVWAGGLRPGHSLTQDGAFNAVLSKNDKVLDVFVNDVIDAMIRDF